MTEPKYLYHYTGFDGLKGILDSKKLWCSDYRSMNDTKEFMHSEELIKKCIQEAIIRYMKENNLKPDPKISNDEFYEKLIQQTDSLWKTLLKALQKHRAYLFCFHTHKDSYAQKNGLLSMWRGYGDYALVFNRKKLDEYIVKMGAEDSNYAAASEFKKVTYLKKISLSLPKAIQDDYDQLKGLLVKRLLPINWGGTPEEMGEEQGLEAYQAILRLISFIKHTCYREEKECRLCLFPVSNDTLEEKHRQFDEIKTEIRKRGSFIVSFIEFPLNTLSFKLVDFVKEIIIGPQRDMETKRDFLEGYLRGQGLTISVRTSEIPYLPR